MKKLQIGFLRNLRNSEFAVIFNHIFTLMEKEKIENELLKDAWERARHHSEKLRFLRDRPPYHLLTRRIQKLIRARTDYLISLRLQVEGKMLSHKPEERLAAKRLNLWLSNCKRSLYRPSITAQSALIEHLLVEQRMFPDIQEAITLLNFDELIDEIADISDQVNHKFKTRMEDTAAKNHKGQELRQAAYDDLKLVVKVMDMLNDMNTRNREATQCYQLSLVLAELLKNAHTILKSRTTKSKNRKEVDSAIAQLINQTKEGAKKNLPMVITNVKEASKKTEDDVTKLSE